jgi:hypothetical protein
MLSMRKEKKDANRYIINKKTMTIIKLIPNLIKLENQKNKINI